LTVPELVGAVLRIPVESVNDDTCARDTDAWSSLAHIQLVAAIEDAYGVRLSAGEIRAMASVSDIRRVLADRGVPAS